MDGIQAMMLKQRRGLDFGLFMKPFHWQVWLVFNLLWIFYSLNLTCVSILSKKLDPSGSSQQPREEFTLQESLAYFSLASVQFGPDRHPVSMSGKLLQQYWSLLLLIIIATYTANLAAIFSEESTIKPLLSIDNIQASSYNVCTGMQYRKVLPDYNNSVLNDLLKEKRLKYFNFTMKPNWTKIVSKSLQSKCVWVVPNADVDLIMRKLEVKDLVYALDGYFNRIPQGFAMRKDWEHAENVSKLILKYTHSGVVEQITRKYGNSHQEHVDKETVQSIEIGSFAGVFCLVFAAGLVALGMSVITFYRKKRLVRSN